MNPLLPKMAAVVSVWADVVGHLWTSGSGQPRAARAAFEQVTWHGECRETVLKTAAISVGQNLPYFIKARARRGREKPSVAGAVGSTALGSHFGASL